MPISKNYKQIIKEIKHISVKELIINGDLAPITINNTISCPICEEEKINSRFEILDIRE